MTATNTGRHRLNGSKTRARAPTAVALVAHLARVPPTVGVARAASRCRSSAALRPRAKVFGDEARKSGGGKKRPANAAALGLRPVFRRQQNVLRVLTFSRRRARSRSRIFAAVFKATNACERNAAFGCCRRRVMIGDRLAGVARVNTACVALVIPKFSAACSRPISGLIGRIIRKIVRLGGRSASRKKRVIRVIKQMFSEQNSAKIELKKFAEKKPNNTPKHLMIDGRIAQPDTRAHAASVERFRWAARTRVVDAGVSWRCC